MASISGLNVHSMLKYETLVLTLPALELIEEKLLRCLHAAEKDEMCRTVVSEPAEDTPVDM